MDLLAVRAVTPAVSFAGGDGLHHEWCCDDAIALCGRGLSGDTDCSGGCASPRCPACAHIEDSGLPCPVPGCDIGAGAGAN